VSSNLQKIAIGALCTILVLVWCLIFKGSLASDLDAWLHDEEYSFGLIVPLLGAYLIWGRRKGISAVPKPPWSTGIFVVLLGCGLQVLASRSGSLVVSGIALILTLIGVTGFIWGKQVLRIVAAPLASLILMVPLPSYVMGELSWHLQSIGSTVSGGVLRSLGVPVFQDGNVLRLSNYVLEVKQACSGFHSIFALLVLSCGIALSTQSRLYIKVLPVLAAPFLALGANVLRIVGTGLIANQWGSLATNKLLHEGLGIAVFLITVVGLLGTRTLALKCGTCRSA